MLETEKGQAILGKSGSFPEYPNPPNILAVPQRIVVTTAPKSPQRARFRLTAIQTGTKRDGAARLVNTSRKLVFFNEIYCRGESAFAP